MILKPTDTWNNLPSEVELVKGAVYQAQFLLSGGKPLHIRGNGALIRGLKLEQLGAVIIEDLVISGAVHHGLMVVRCASLSLSNVEVLDSAVNGILTGNTPDVMIRNCTANRSGSGHGLYCSQSGDRIHIESCTFNCNSRAGIQINADQPSRKANQPNDDAVSNNVVITKCFLSTNQVAGGASINLAAVHGFEVSDCSIMDCLGRDGIALWDDGTGIRELACRDGLITGIGFGFHTNQRKTCINIGSTCENIRVASSNRYPSGVTGISGKHIDV